MASVKQQEEKRIKFLRRMVALPHNRHCFDCGQRGPTYVNMTIGSYVCTACSGILRGINPPHRVKSVSMASFTQEEVDMLTQRGNEYNKQVWLGLHDTKEPPVIDTKDEIKLRDYLTQKYEKKRWYLAPTDGLSEAAKTMNNQNPHPNSAAGSAIRRPIGGFRISNPSSSTPVALPKTIAPPSASTQSAVPAPAAVSAPAQSAAVPLPSQPQVQPTANSSALLADVFAPTNPAADNSQANNEFQANFANFSDLKPTSQPAPAAQPNSEALLQWCSGDYPRPESTPVGGLGLLDLTTPAAAPPGSSNAAVGAALLQADNMADPSALAQQPAGGTNQWSASNSAAGGGGDRYAQLTGLFSLDASEGAPPPAASIAPAPQTNAPVNWNSINWGGGGGTTQAQSTPPQAGINWGGSAMPPAQTVPSTAGFGQPVAAPVNNGWGNVPSSGVNPFLVNSAGAQPPAQPQFSAAFGTPPTQAGFGTPPTQSGFAAFPQQQAPMAQTNLSSGFAYQQARPAQPQGQMAPGAGFGVAQMTAGFAAFPQTQPAATNGQFGASMGGGMSNGSANQWGAAPAAGQWGNPVSQAPPQQWGAVPAKQQAAANPFLMQNQPIAAPIQQHTMATNPFL